MKTIVEMAREAGFKIIDNMIFVEGWEINPYMQRFAELVRADEREAAEERVADLFADMENPYLPDIIAAIRARGNT